MKEKANGVNQRKGVRKVIDIMHGHKKRRKGEKFEISPEFPKLNFPFRVRGRRKMQTGRRTVEISAGTHGGVGGGDSFTDALHVCKRRKVFNRHNQKFPWKVINGRHFELEFVRRRSFKVQMRPREPSCPRQRNSRSGKKKSSSVANLRIIRNCQYQIR